MAPSGSVLPQDSKSNGSAAHPPSILRVGMCNDASKDTDWEAGVSGIASILDQNSDAYNVLTEEQRESLRSVQRILLMDGGKEDVGDWAHVPRNIRESKEPSMRYLRQVFSNRGILEGLRKEDRKGKLRRAVLANSIVRNFMDGLDKAKLSAMVDEDSNGYLPREWSILKEEAKERLKVILSWDNLCRWDFNVFELEELTGGQPLLFMGWAILGSPGAQIAMAGGNLTQEEGGPTKGYGFCDMFKIPPNVLFNFIRSIEGDYVKENPYHNAIHAADVTQTAHAILEMGGVHYGADLEIFSLLLAAIIHDVGHPGYNNAFQVNEKTSLALIYNDKSVLENMHASHAFTKLMGEDAKPDIDILAGMTDRQKHTVRQFAIEAVLHTDMTTHFSTVDALKGLLATKSPEEIQTSDRAAEALWYMLHLADISNPTKPGKMKELWTDRCLEEFFRQGDKEKKLGFPVSPLCDRETTSRAEAQIGFIQYVVKPSFEVLGRLLPELEGKIMPAIDSNMEFWRTEASDEKEKEA
eukprot:CAMPEP_0183291906 /NCGR_PEP_ID=MMETSP0160_2-20130417/1157_1 /TAXON_ID=2839 ORGANISM="Odontella Sinensis, Strain Grunow 1884" /NCGR_SAMPLE_ID=MMETSP0160_2 /ASSEMBLY_ACC=CAM_ASM_000250 /LENGTH=524 /DNA_ID=CAMNT_0025452777 /DNA_START=12 /DNA_END=1586 /DNA_ORIENTATION=+